MLLNNYAVRNQGQSRSLGGNLDPTYNFAPSKMQTFYMIENGVAGANDKVSFPESGMRPPYSLVLPPDTGGMSSLYTARATATATANGQMGVYIDSLATVTVTAEATLQLVASLIGTAAVSVTTLADIEGIAGLEGTGSVTVTTSADIFATGSLITSTPVSVSGAADIFATGSMHSLVYLNQSQAQVADFWNATAAQNNNPGTMGEKLNDAGSAGNPWTDTTDYAAGTKGALLQNAADDADTAANK